MAEARSAAKHLEVKLQRQDRALVAALATAAERAGQLQALDEVLREEPQCGEWALYKGVEVSMSTWQCKSPPPV